MFGNIKFKVLPVVAVGVCSLGFGIGVNDSQAYGANLCEKLRTECTPEGAKSALSNCEVWLSLNKEQASGTTINTTNSDVSEIGSQAKKACELAPQSDKCGKGMEVCLKHSS